MGSLNCMFLLTVAFFCISEGTLAAQTPWDLEQPKVDHICRRACNNNEHPLTCHFVFVVEKYSSMSKACYDCPSNITDCYRPDCIPADGIQKLLYVVNRQMPGPSVEVCEGDTIIVDVKNAMLSESTTIHWHGFKQKGSPYMDGVPFVTQCPIVAGQTFRYKFQAENIGTYFWHSHMGNQKTDGLFGPLIIWPRTKNDYSQKDYDIDGLRHYMVVTDWSQRSGDEAMIKQYHDRIGINPTNILVNGWGRQITNIGNATQTNIPNYVFHVKKNTRSRFRLINAGSEDCPMEISIDEHPMTVISMDSNDIESVEVDAVTIWPGERIDFIINSNRQIGNYWIRFRGYGLCQDVNNPNKGVYQVAILRYDGAPAEDPKGLIGYVIPLTNARVLNPYQRGTEALALTDVNVPHLNAKQPDDASLSEKVDQQIFINFDFYPLDNNDFHRKGLYGFYQVPQIRRIGSFQLNHISFQYPSYSLLSQRDQIKPEDFCNENTIPKNCSEIHCACTHVIPLKYNAVVELVFLDEGKYAVVNHPIHLHGHFFRIIATEKLQGNVTVERFKEMDRQGLIHRRLGQAPFKDTMKAPGGGYTIVRFVANNPGYWFLHCHFEQHSNVGMALVFKVGEHSDMPPVPKNFPTCGNFDPPIEDKSQTNEKYHGSQTTERYDRSQTTKRYHESQTTDRPHDSQTTERYHESQTTKRPHESQTNEKYHGSQTTEKYHGSQTTERYDGSQTTKRYHESQTTDRPHESQTTERPYGSQTKERPHGLQPEWSHGPQSSEWPHELQSSEWPHGSQPEWSHGPQSSEWPHESQSSEWPHKSQSSEWPHVSQSSGRHHGPQSWEWPHNSQSSGRYYGPPPPPPPPPGRYQESSPPMKCFGSYSFRKCFG